MKSKTGDKGQRYEIWCYDDDPATGGTEMRVGWSNNPEAFADMVAEHPIWCNHRAIDRQAKPPAEASPPEWWEGENERIDPLPIVHPQGFDLTRAIAFCPTCGGEGGVITQHAYVRGACIECKQHAACWQCLTRFNSQVRFYATHWMYNSDAGWITVERKNPGVFACAIQYIRRLLPNKS